MFKKIVLTVVVVIIAAVVVAYFVRNLLAAKAIEAGSSYALGVKTDVGSASLNLGGGSLGLNNFVVVNPSGFDSKSFLTLQHGSVTVDAGSVFNKEVKIDSIIIDGVGLDLEQIDGKGNYQVLLDNIKKMDMSSSGESQKFRIGLIALRDIDVSGSLRVMGKDVKKSFKLDNFSLRNVGGDNGAQISEVTAQVVRTLISNALASGTGLLPEGFGANLGELKAKGIEEIKSKAEDKLKDLGGALTGGKK
jgi:hypothetical protein